MVPGKITRRPGRHNRLLRTAALNDLPVNVDAPVTRIVSAGRGPRLNGTSVRYAPSEGLPSSSSQPRASLLVRACTYETKAPRNSLFR